MSINIKANNTTHTIPEEYQYSTSESVYTGRKWIDGKKIYSTVMSISVSSGWDGKSALPTCCKGLIDTLVNLSAMWLDTSSNWRHIPVAHQDNSRDGVGLNVLGSNGNNLYVIKNAESWGGTKLLVILEYTKTAD